MLLKLAKNKDCYCGETIDIEDILNRCILSAEKSGFEIEKLCVAEGCNEILVFRKSGAGKKVYISAGIHGDEPAPPLTILELLSKNEWPEDFDISIFPCLNPVGFKHNTRECEQKIDLNRDYYHCKSPKIQSHRKWLESAPCFDLALCLHEDWESEGFYLYESIHDGYKSIAEDVLNGVREVFPIDESEEIDGFKSKNGVINSHIDHLALNHWPEGLYLYEVKKTSNYTLETSSDFPLEDRVKAMVVAVRAALKSI